VVVLLGPRSRSLVYRPNVNRNAVDLRAVDRHRIEQTVDERKNTRSAYRSAITSGGKWCDVKPARGFVGNQREARTGVQHKSQRASAVYHHVEVRPIVYQIKLDPCDVASARHVKLAALKLSIELHHADDARSLLRVA